MTMSEQQIEQLHENTYSIEGLKNKLDLILKVAGIIGGIITFVWYVATFVIGSKNSEANTSKEITQLQKHMDLKFEEQSIKIKEQADSIKNISQRQLINQVTTVNSFSNVNNRLDKHDNSLKSLNEKCDRLNSGGFVTEHTDKPGGRPTLTKVQ